MRARKTGLSVPSVEHGLDLAQVHLRRRFFGDVESGRDEASRDVDRRDEAISADKAQEVLTGMPTEPRAAFGQVIEKANLIIGRPSSQEFSEAAVLACGFGDERRIRPDGADLLRVAHDARIARESVPEFVGFELQAGR